MSANIIYKTDILPSPQQIISLYESAELKRPTDDPERIEAMYANSNLVITAWEGEQLVGVSRSVTDFCYACYLSDLAVKKEFQKRRIGKKLIAKTKEAIGEKTMLLLLSVPTAMTYYPKVGFEKVDCAFKINRTI